MLTLSATPIPRTLNMAMSGIRDLSTIEQPPIERQPVETFVLEYNDVILAEAMKKELARGGRCITCTTGWTTSRPVPPM